MAYAYRILTFLVLCTATAQPNTLHKNRESKNTMNQNTHAPYHEEAVSFQNTKGNLTIAGTFTRPSGNGTFPTVLLIAGMGPNDRDATTYAGKKPFLVLADHLTRHGIAVLRVDKRGVGESTGVFNTTVTSQDLADDVVAGIDYLVTRTDVDAQKIGLIGHSEGGMIAAMVAATQPRVAFVVVMAGAVVTTIEAFVAHTALQLRADGASDAMLAADRAIRTELLTIFATEPNAELAETKAVKCAEQYWAKLPEAVQQESETLLFAFTQQNMLARIQLYNSPWFRFFLSYSPSTALQKITVPVLALNGEYDWISSPTIIFPVVEQALKTAGNSDYTLATLPKLNHSLQTCQTGSIAEYATLTETLAPQALSTMSDWITARTLQK